MKLFLKYLQNQGIEKRMLQELKKFVVENGVKGTDIFVELCAVPEKYLFMKNMDSQQMKRND